MKKRICFVTDGHPNDPSNSINGSQVQSYLLAKALATREYNVHYIAQTLNQDKKDKILKEKVRIHWVKKTQRQLLKRTLYLQYKEKLTRIKPEICYQRGRSFLTYICGCYAKQNNAKFIWASNDENGCEPSKYVPNLLKSSKSFWKKIVLFPQAYWEDRLFSAGIKMADKVVNQTHFQKQKLLSNFGKEGIIIRSTHSLPSHIKKKVNPRTVLWLSSLCPRKQPELFISLAKRFDYIKDWKFLLVGGTKDVKFQHKIQRACKKLSNLEMIGAVSFEKSYEYFNEASLFICTSQYEGFPNTYVQAWMAGIPIISLNVDPDHLIEKYKLGIFAKGNFETLISTVNELMVNKQIRNEMSCNVRNFAIEHFNVVKIVDQYEMLFQG